MKFIVDFYKGLDAVNLIIFWGVIIVVLLLLVFAIIIANKNRKLERIIEKSGIDIDNFDDNEELAIKKVTNNQVDVEENKSEEKKENDKIEENKSEEKKENDKIEENKSEEKKEITITNQEEKKYSEVIDMSEITEKPEKEEKFIAEEHVMEYQNEVPKAKSHESVRESTIVSAPYQRNILREVYSNQTSPIGISKNNDSTKSEIYKANELHEALNDENKKEQDPALLNQKKYVDTYNQNTRKGDYLAELSKKLSDTSKNNDITRTDYEIQQEEDAIISYEELMQKKDNIKTIDEEDAVISINELIKRNQEKEKIYNITKDEENEEFINELKHFRSDL